MPKLEIQSREEKLQNAWAKYFDSIEKENKIIRIVLKYYGEELFPVVSKSFKNIDLDKTLSDSELRCKLLSIINDVNHAKTTIPNSLFNPYIKYLKILQEVRTKTQKLRPNFKQNYFDSIYLGDFKGFSVNNERKDNNVDIKPITLIYGPNSYGKSSILQSLLLLNQTANKGGDYKDVCLLPNGEMVNLGRFQDFLNRNSKDKEIIIEMTLPWNHYVNEDEEKLLSTIIENTINNNLYNENLLSNSYGICDTSLLEKLSFGFHFALDKNEIIMSQIDIISEQTDYTCSDAPQKLGKTLLYSFKRQISNGNEVYVCKEKNKEVFKKSFFRLEEVMYGNSFEKVEDIIKSAVYLSSFRQPPARYYVPENNTRKYVGKNGEYTSEILYDDDVNSDINEWLNKLTGYELSSEKKDAEVHSITLNDDNTDLKNINLIDLGSGIAQVLPIITQAFKSKGDMVLIEEPEIHLHPKAQAELGEMFADAIKKTDNTFIIETHSENLMLRLGKLIRRGEISKDDVSIIYVDKNKEKGSHCISLILNDNGDIKNINDVPGGFFDEGFNELFL